MGKINHFKVPSILLAMALLSCKSAPELDSEAKKTFAASNRSDLIKTMEIWRPVDTASLDLFLGGDNKYRFAQNVQCEYLDLPKSEYGTGRSPKFKCREKESGNEIKVKYGVDNGEIYAEMAFSRLMYALGFFHDHYYPVRVSCSNCPKDPWDYIKRGEVNGNKPRAHGVVNFVPALIERKHKGDRIENKPNQGVTWEEFNDYYGLTHEQKKIRDAYILLMAFVQHVDAKPDQQRLVCLKKKSVKLADGSRFCEDAQFLVQDGGWTFGGAFEFGERNIVARMSLKHWKGYKVFKDKNTCLTNNRAVPFSGFKNKEISEDGRQFLADLLSKLSRDQIKDLFRATRVDLRDEVLFSTPREETIEAWTSAFEEKVEEITSTKCPKKLLVL